MAGGSNGEINRGQEKVVEQPTQSPQAQETISSDEAKRQFEGLFSKKKDELHSIVHKDFFLNRDAHQERDELLKTVDRVLDTQLQDWNRDIAAAEGEAGKILKAKFDEFHGQASELLVSLHSSLTLQLEDAKYSNDWSSLPEILPTAHFSKEEVKGVGKSIDMHAFVVNTGILQVDYLKSEYYAGAAKADPREATIMAIEECVKRGWLKDQEALALAQRLKLEQDQRLQAGHLYDIEDSDHQEMPEEIRPKEANPTVSSEPLLEAHQESEVLDLTAGIEYIVQKGDTPQKILVKLALGPKSEKYDNYMIWMELQKNGKPYLLEGQKLIMPDDAALQKAREYMKPEEIKKRCLEATSDETKIKLQTDYERSKVRLDQLFDARTLYVNSPHYNDKPGQYICVQRYNDGHYHFFSGQRFYVYGGETVRTEPPQDEPVVAKSGEQGAAKAPEGDSLEQSFATPEAAQSAMAKFMGQHLPKVFGQLTSKEGQTFTFNSSKVELVQQISEPAQYKLSMLFSDIEGKNHTVEAAIQNPSELTEAKLTDILTSYLKAESAQVAQKDEAVQVVPLKAPEATESPAEKLKKIDEKLPKES